MKKSKVVESPPDEVMAMISQPRTVPRDKLTRVMEAGAQIMAQTMKVANLQEELQREADFLRKLQQEELPALMDECEMKECTLTSGMKLVRDQDIYANISSENVAAATGWLRKNNLGSIIKNSVRIDLKRDDDAMLERLRKGLTKIGVKFSIIPGVHPQTLKAFVKEQLEKGTKLPDSISVHIQPIVRIKGVKS